MTKSKTKLVRMDIDSEKRLRDIMKARYEKGLAKFKISELSVAEAMRLQFRCPSWINVENELRTMPKNRGKNGK